MSTKIYNGFIFKKGMTLEDILQECEIVRRMIHKQRQRKEATFAMQKAVAILDARTLGLKDRDERPELSPFSAATMALLDSLHEASNTELRGNILDFKFEVVVIPISGGKILGLTFTEQRDWEKMWLTLPFVREYHYQNQTDPPSEDEVSSEEWAQREKDWEEALRDDAPHIQGTPALCGITFTLCLSTGGTFPKIASSMRFLPKLENRVKAIAFDMLWMEYAREQGVDRDAEDDDDQDDESPEVSDVTTAYFEYRRWVQKPEGKVRLEAKKLEVEGRLIHPIKAEHLQPKPKQE